MTAYRAMLSARFRLLLQYRAAALAGLATQLFWGLIRMMIFQAFYAGATSTPPMPLDHVVTYVWLGQALLCLLPFRVDHELDRMIRSGNVAYELLRPVDLYAFWYARAVATRTAPTLLRAAPLLVIATLTGWIRWPAPQNVLACAAALTGAVLLTSAITMLMNVSLFWTLSGRGINAIATASLFLLSGMIVPLPLFPEALQPVLNFLPFRGICDVPYRLFTGHIPPGELPGVLAHQAAWIVALVLIGRWLLRRAARRVVIQGG